jgi:outer membrane protein assembly factor BamB
MQRALILPWAGLMVLVLGGADWRQFRGTDSRGVAAEPVPSHAGSDPNIAWKVELPDRGLSAPIIVGERLFLTASGGPRKDRLHVLAFDAKSGQKLWQRSFWGTGPADSHPKTCMAAPTPASDGQHLVALFATDDLVGLDLDGNVLWVRSLYEENPGATDGRGLASSPIVIGGTVVVQVETQNTSFAAGVDLDTGANRWRIDRAREITWSSPIPLPGKTPAEDLVLLQGATRLSACDPATGREVWGLDKGSHPIASSVLTGNQLIVPGEKGLLAFELQPGPAAPKLLWENAKLNPDVASPVVLGDRVYALHGAVLAAGDLKTGELRGQLRVKGPFSASLVVAGGLLYCVNESGLVQVAKPGEKEPVLVASFPLGETILCTPAIADGSLYVRSDKHLWKIGKPSSTSSDIPKKG